MKTFYSLPHRLHSHVTHIKRNIASVYMQFILMCMRMQIETDQKCRSFRSHMQYSVQYPSILCARWFELYLEASLSDAKLKTMNYTTIKSVFFVRQKSNPFRHGVEFKKRSESIKTK